MQLLLAINSLKALPGLIYKKSDEHNKKLLHFDER
jgi:hypothetical protein